MEADCRVLIFFAARDLRDASTVEKRLVGVAADAGGELVFHAMRRHEYEKRSD